MNSPNQIIGGTQIADLEEKYDILSEDYGRLLAQLQWTHGVLALLIEEQGGFIEIDKELLADFKVGSMDVMVYENELKNRFIITTQESETND